MSQSCQLVGFPLVLYLYRPAMTDPCATRRVVSGAAVAHESERHATSSMTRAWTVAWNGLALGEASAESRKRVSCVCVCLRVVLCVPGRLCVCLRVVVL